MLLTCIQYTSLVSLHSYVCLWDIFRTLALIGRVLFFSLFSVFIYFFIRHTAKQNSEEEKKNKFINLFCVFSFNSNIEQDGHVIVTYGSKVGYSRETQRLCAVEGE